MAKEDIATQIDKTGLRYSAKAPGSPFAAKDSFSAATMSCFKCGKHRPRSALMTKRLLGKARFVCSPSCAEASAVASNGGTKPAPATTTATPATPASENAATKA
jgi:hypothetical protein